MSNKQAILEQYATAVVEFNRLPNPEKSVGALQVALQAEYDRLHNIMTGYETAAEQLGFYGELVSFAAQHVLDLENETMTVKEAAEQLGYDEKKVRRQIRKGDIKARKNESGEWEIFVQKLTITE